MAGSLQNSQDEVADGWCVRYWIHDLQRDWDDTQEVELVQSKTLRDTALTASLYKSIPLGLHSHSL